MSDILKRTNFKVKDEYYTPKVLVECLDPYIPKDKTIWCPFDKEKSEYVYFFKDRGNKVIYSHIDDGKDFFNYEPENYDIIVSNPPFSKKLEILKRCYELKKPFALLLPVNILNYKNINTFFITHKVQLLIVNEKVSFNGNTSMFNCSYFCNGILDKDLEFIELPHNNTGKKFIPSRMYDTDVNSLYPSLISNKECNYCSDEGECLIENCICHNCNEKYIDDSPEKVCLKYCDYEIGDEECVNCIWRIKNERKEI